MRKEMQRAWRAFFFSLEGLHQAWQDRGAFRTEAIFTPFIVLLACYLGETGVERAVLLGGWGIILVAELLNTAIEAAVDLMTQGALHPLAKKAKDTASAAVFVACMLCGVIWALCLCPF